MLNACKLLQYVNCFHENRKEGKEVEEVITTINFSYLIIKLKKFSPLNENMF